MFAIDHVNSPMEDVQGHQEPQGRDAGPRSIPVRQPEDLEMEPVSMSRSHSNTPPINIASPAPVRSADRIAMHNAGLLAEKLDHELVKSKAAKRKKKKRGLKPGAPAANTIRGFHTPIASGGEESDASGAATPVLRPKVARGLSSLTSSPSMRPASSNAGISALKLQLDTLNLSAGSERPSPRPAISRLQTNSSSTSLASDALNDGRQTETDSYEINFEQDFVSPDVATKSFGESMAERLAQSSASRKMTAEDFDPLHCLGKGAYGTVLLVKQRETGRLYAQKQFRKATLTVHKKLVEQTKTERSILESVNRHPFIVNLYYAFQDREKLYLILEYAQGGELFHHLAMERMFSEEVAAFYMAELVLALEHLHNAVGVVYRDLKPENCLLDADGHLLLTDFGLSKVAVDENDRSNSVLGTIEYMAPEVVKGINYGPAVDWWSLGALGFDLLTGSPPFQGNNHAKPQEKILRQKLTMPYFLGPDAKDLLTRLLRKDPNKRLGSNMPRDMQTIRKHRFFRKIDWKLLAKRELEPPIQPLVTDPELAENFSNDFTDLALSPVVRQSSGFGSMAESVPQSAVDSDPFGGFSFVASSSLLESSTFAF